MQPATLQEAAEALRAAGEESRAVRLRGGGTKSSWGRAVADPGSTVSTAALGRIVEHNAGDLTAVLEAGVPLAHAQAAFASERQMLALDPPLGEGEAATVGGVVAAADSGPLRHRYGAPRDLLVGMTVALADGTVARSGGRVIKNVAGYDLAKLFAGSFGTLGLIAEVAVRLHPLPRARVTAVGAAEEPGRMREAALRLATAPLELESLDVAWEAGSGRLLARCAGAAPDAAAGEAVRIMAAEGLEAGVEEADEGIWAAQRTGQRSAEGTVLRVSGLPADLGRVLTAVDGVGGAVVGRAALGLFWVKLEGLSREGAVGAVEQLRRDLDPFPCAALDAPLEVRAAIDVWGGPEGPALELTRRVKDRFDPARVCNPGLLAEGL